jgi:hypothetical protein
MSLFHPATKVQRILNHFFSVIVADLSFIQINLRSKPISQLIPTLPHLDGLSAAEIDIGPGEVVQTFVVAPDIVYATKAQHLLRRRAVCTPFSFCATQS